MYLQDAGTVYMEPGTGHLACVVDFAPTFDRVMPCLRRAFDVSTPHALKARIGELRAVVDSDVACATVVYGIDLTVQSVTLLARDQGLGGTLSVMLGSWTGVQG